MNIDPQLKLYTEGLFILYVEDDKLSATILKKHLEQIFSVVMGASDGLEALEVFRTHKPDLIISDLMMPNLDGIGMLKEIRKTDQKIPVIIMTASLDRSHLVEAINLGVSKFLSKPYMPPDLHKALFYVTRELHLEKFEEQAQRQELELLKYRNRYHSSQQELALAKEQHIVRNMMENLWLPEPDGRGWLVDTARQSRDIMSGDSYSIKRNTDGRIKIFLADAMGHGLSASVTSMLTTAFFNHAADGCACVNLGFQHLVSSTMTFASRNLLEDEVFSGLVMELDPSKGTLGFACCGMPPILIVRNGVVERLKCGNPPVTAFSAPLRFQEIELSGVSDILMVTDGLTDAPMSSGGGYGDRLSEDLLNSTTAAELFALYNTHCNDMDNDDDLTLIRLSRVGAWHDTTHLSFRAKGTLKGVAELQTEIVSSLKAAGAAGESLESLELALSEALLNAFEHGCLGLGADKHRLLIDGEYDEVVSAAGNDPDKEIRVELYTANRMGRLQVWLEIADPGPGFDAERRLARGPAKTAASGRGFIMMKRSVNLLRRNSEGNRLVIMQMFDIV